MGVAKDGTQKENFQRGVELRGKLSALFIFLFSPFNLDL